MTYICYLYIWLYTHICIQPLKDILYVYMDTQIYITIFTSKHTVYLYIFIQHVYIYIYIFKSIYIYVFLYIKNLVICKTFAQLYPYSS